MGPSGGAIANAKRRMAAADKLNTPIGVQPYPYPPGVKRQALVAPISLQAIPSRLANARAAGQS